MKKNLLLLGILAFSAPAFAQFGLQAGATFRSSKIEVSSISLDMKSTVGFTGGVYYKKPLGGTFAVQPELNWLQKGGEYSEEGGKLTYDINYIELPVYFLYTGGQTSGFYGGLGPSFNFGLSGTAEESMEGFGEEKWDIEFGDDEDSDLKGFHMGFNILVGYQLKGGLNFNGFFSTSITNSVPGDVEEDAKWSFMNYGLRLGYTFGMDATAKQAKSAVKPIW